MNLEDGGFILFGYTLDAAGDYCYGGHAIINGRSTCWGSTTSVANGDARWFWEYYPVLTEPDYYYQLGPPMSAGANGTWHSYSIVPFHGRTSGWEFRLDGTYVSSLDGPTSASKNPIYVAADHLTTEAPARLGPVEFRDLRYLTSNGWKSVGALYALNGCGVNTPCNFPHPYGVVSLGPNHVLAGSGVNQTVSNKELLWPSTFSSSTVVLTTTAPPILSTGSTIMTMTDFAFGLIIIGAIVAVSYKNRKVLHSLTMKIVAFLTLPPVQSVEKTSQQQADRSEEATRSDVGWDEGRSYVKLRSQPTRVTALLVLAILHVAVLVYFMRSIFVTMETNRLGTYASQLYLETVSGTDLLLIFFVLLAFSISWAAAGYGLLIRTRWGWKLTLVLAAIGIAYSLLTLRMGNWLSGIIVLVVELVAICCLIPQQVKVFFANAEASVEE
jgi:hypothetical protein